MARRAGPSVRSRRLAIALRKLRMCAGLSGAEVAKSVGMSGSKISRVENAESGIYLDDVAKLLDFYQVTEKRRVELLELARHSEERGWLRMHSANLPEDWQTWLDFEDEASALLNYEPLMMPGLLQTAEYARAIIRATGSELPDAEVDALVTSRMARQGLLSRAKPLKLHALIEEHVLSRTTGDAAVLGRQLRHLVDSAARPNITIQVVPVQAGLHPGLNGPFVLLEYDDEASMVWLENKLSSLILDEDEQIAAYGAAWNELRELAHSPGESVELIAAVAAKFAQVRINTRVPDGIVRA